MCGRSLCLVKGRKIGLRRRYALREGASAVAVGVGAWWRQQRRRVGRAVGEARVARCQGEGRATCRGCAREDQKAAAGEGVESCEAKLPTELRGWETGRCGSLGGCSEVGGGGGGGSCLVATASAGFLGSGGSWG